MYREYEEDGLNCETICKYRPGEWGYAHIGSQYCMKTCSYFDGELNENTIICNIPNPDINHLTNKPLKGYIIKGNEMIKYRDHKRTLNESMDTVQEFKNKNELIIYLKSSLSIFKYTLNEEDLIIEKYCFDDRIEWNTYIVSIKGFGVVGFTNGSL